MVCQNAGFFPEKLGSNYSTKAACVAQQKQDEALFLPGHYPQVTVEQLE